MLIRGISHTMAEVYQHHLFLNDNSKLAYSHIKVFWYDGETWVAIHYPNVLP